jgi:GT2 family glycosyltransferase
MTYSYTNVWIVILNWNGLHDTLECLDSLAKIKSEKISITTLVVDNGSQINECSEIAKIFPAVQTICLENNIGFAGGCNLGIEKALAAQADYVLLLNNDTIVDPDFLEQMLIYSRVNPQAGIVGPLICYDNEPDTVWFAGAKIILAIGYFEHQYLNQKRSKVPIEPFVCNYVSGCCMLLSRSVLQTCGKLEERLFAYFEDADFCLRAQKANFSSVCVPTSVIWHKESASTRRGLKEGNTSPLKHYLMARNRIYTVREHASVSELICFYLIGNTYRAVYFTSAFLLRKRWTKMKWFWRGIIDGLQDRFEKPFM